MSLCRKCVKRILEKHRSDRPTNCVRCHLPLPAKRERVGKDDPRRWLCDDCAELVVERETDACFMCGTPFTPTGFRAMRQAQKDPREKPAYLRRIQGRQVA